ncbi:hypothetical protein GE09DRAFT_1213988 [Coniochaeta sp. 2T2.1]|nr:hypothetical protein GE09DRAFT_1213988 [Coniochaeta sp. 2T2.1]
MSNKDFAAEKPVTSRDKSDPRQRTAANGGGEPPSSTPMMDAWLKKTDLAHLTVTEFLFAKARSRAFFLFGYWEG